jgi:phosphatidate phosphatase PAH1
MTFDSPLSTAALRLSRFAAMGLLAIAAGACAADDGTGDEADLTQKTPAKGAWCSPIPKCDAAGPSVGAAQSWNHSVASKLVTAAGSPNHRGRDLFLNPGDPQWILGKFAYGLVDKDLKDEKVDIYLNRGCAKGWEKLGTSTTTNDGDHETVEGVEDTGGRVFFQIPAAKQLAAGRHRVRLVVQGDLSFTDLFIEVVPKGAPIFVSDVDGTLTESENAEFPALLTGKLPAVHPNAAADYQALVAKGYHPVYLTARPDWLTKRTHEFLDTNGFPPGIVHTTVTLTGAMGSAAAAFKTDELSMLADKGLVPAYGFGNTASDAQAYESATVPVAHRFFYQFDDTVFGGTRIEDYGDILKELKASPSLCK